MTLKELGLTTLALLFATGCACSDNDPLPADDAARAGTGGARAGDAGSAGDLGNAGDPGTIPQGGSGGTGSGNGGASGSAGTGGSGGNAGAPPGPPHCADRNPCTTDLHDGSQCVSDPVADGSPCSDGDPCTIGDTCVAGTCTAGSRSQANLKELGRVRTFATDAGAVIEVSPDRLLFVDPAESNSIWHSARVGSETLTIEAASFPSDRTRAVPYSFRSIAPRAGWPGHAAIGSNYSEYVHVVTIALDGSLSFHPPLELPRSGGFLVGQLNGLAGHGHQLWACVNYAFFGPPSGALFGYDLTDPDAPVLVHRVGMPAVDCGSIAVTADGSRVFVNSSRGIHWFDPAVRDDAGNILVNAPFGTNSGIAIFGDKLLARGVDAVVLYDVASRTPLLTIAQPGLTAATYVPEHEILALIRTTQTGNAYERTLAIHDARQAASGAALDEVLLDRDDTVLSAERIPAVGGFIVDPRTKATFRVGSARELVRVATPEFGGTHALGRSATGVQAWSTTSLRAVDLSDPASPAWTPGGGPELGRTRRAGLDLTATPPTLVSWNVSDSFQAPLADRQLINSSTRTKEGAIPLVLREWGAQGSTEAGEVLLLGTEPGALQWTDDALYRLDALAPPRGILRAWDRTRLLPGSAPVPPSRVVEFTTSAAPANARNFEASLDFPDSANVGLGVLKYIVQAEPVTYAIRFYWFDRSEDPPQLLEEYEYVDSASGSVHDCRVAGARVACVTKYGGDLLLLERQESGPPTARLVDAEYASRSILKFDGGFLYLADARGLVVVPWNITAEAMSTAPRIPFASYPMASLESDSGLVVASSHELVTIQPACAAEQ